MGLEICDRFGSTFFHSIPAFDELPVWNPSLWVCIALLCFFCFFLVLLSLHCAYGLDRRFQHLGFTNFFRAINKASIVIGMASCFACSGALPLLLASTRAICIVSLLRKDAKSNGISTYLHNPKLGITAGSCRRQKKAWDITRRYALLPAGYMETFESNCFLLVLYGNSLHGTLAECFGTLFGVTLFEKSPFSCS